MATDPADVHPEYDTYTPENADEWTDEQIEAWREAKEQALHQESEQRRVEAAERNKEALDALRSVVDEDAETPTAEVALGEATVTVVARFDGSIEERLDYINKHREDIAEIRDTIISVLCDLIVEDDRDGAYQDPDVWQAYYREYGSEGLIKAFYRLAEPGLDRQEELESFRPERHGGGTRGRR